MNEKLARRVVLLGASNVTRGITRIIPIARTVAGGGIDVLAAHGHGRSYGYSSRVLWRGLPAILNCGIWEELDKRPEIPTWGLITDVGNDIVYGASVDEIADWVSQCVTRLKDRCERIVMTELPMASVTSVSQSRFKVVRSILFPKSNLTFDVAIGSAQRLNSCLREIASDHNLTLITQPRSWFGFDPIHIRRTHYMSAWQHILSHWSDSKIDNVVRRSWFESWRIRMVRPENRIWFGAEQRHRQPSTLLHDGTRISFY